MVKMSKIGQSAGKLPKIEIRQDETKFQLEEPSETKWRWGSLKSLKI